MLFHFFLFPLFLLSIVSLGAVFFHLLSKLMARDIRGDLSIQGLSGLFFLGMTGVTFNFFIPLASPVFLCTISAGIIYGTIILFKEKSRFSKVDFFLFFVVSVILSPLAGTMKPGYDGGLYHLPQQLWLRSEPIVVGLANLHGRFGFGSLYEYISAPLWINEQFTLLSYLQVSFVVFFLFFLIKQVLLSHGTHLTLLLGVSVNLALFSGYHLNLKYTYTDVPAGFLFVCAFVYGHWLLFREEASCRGEWAIFSVLLLSAFFYKLSTAILVFWMLFVILYRILFKKDSVREYFLGVTIPIGLLLIFLVKNFITTGCILYPEAASCLDVSWAASKNAINDSNWVTAWARHPHSGLSSLKNNSWLLSWWFPYYQTFLTKWIAAGLAVGTLYAGLSLRTKFRSVKILDIRLCAAIFFTLLALTFWFWQAPNPRFGAGVFILFFPILFLCLRGNSFKETKKSRMFLRVTAFIAIIIFTCRIGVPWERMSFEDALTINTLTVPKPGVKKDQDYGVRPREGDLCWLVPECAPYDRPPKSYWQGRAAFYEN